MSWRACEPIGWVLGGASPDASSPDAWWWSGRAAGYVRLAILLGLVCVCVMGRAASTMAAAERCPNEEFRTGPSARLPDCRAYELITPEDLGRTQAITFTGSDHAIPSADGEHLMLETFAPLEPGPSITGTRAVFSRTPEGWKAKSLVAPEDRARLLKLRVNGVLSSDLAEVAFESATELNQVESTSVPVRYEIGPVGGPYAVVAEMSLKSGSVQFAGANGGTVSVSPFNDVLLESRDHQLLPPGPERKIAEDAEPGAFDLYDWTGGALRLVNLEGEDSTATSLNTCGGGRLGAGSENIGQGAVGAVSADASKIFFTSCGRLYMRIDGKDTVEISAPQGVTLNSSERTPVHYNAASADGSEVVFNTTTPLLPGESTSENKLFVYDTETNHLSFIAGGGVAPTDGTGGDKVLISEDGSAVYYNVAGSMYRYATQTGERTLIAAIEGPAYEGELSYSTPDGRFLVFAATAIEVNGPHGREVESRGAGHNQLYRYDSSDGSVVCVSCGEGVAPTEGEMLKPDESVFASSDGTPPFIEMSENGQRVFFQTTARLVPQDTNSTDFSTAGPFAGMDVYEWEAEGVEEAPGAVCRGVHGCTHLISTGEDVGKATFLGASADGSNIFFGTAGQLVPQAAPEFPNIYDARVDGGFAPPTREVECTSCQGVGSPSPIYGPGATGTFVGVGNPALPVFTLPSPPKKATIKCPKGKKLGKSKCVNAKRRKKAKKASRGSRR